MIDRKEIDVWLIPRSDEPFSLGSEYDRSDKLFDPEFRRHFAQKYSVIGHSKYYDLYGPVRSTGATGT